jgi:hypothetical protein
LPDTEPFSGFKLGNAPLSAFIFILRSGKNPPVFAKQFWNNSGAQARGVPAKYV